MTAFDSTALLGRPERRSDPEALRAMVAGARVLVTGAGGTIGSELARQVAAAGAACVVLLNHSEAALYAIDAEIGEAFPTVPRAAVLADVCGGGLAQILDRHRPELVFHAAGIKHVPMSEANPEAAVLTNVFGTRDLARACLATGVVTMLLISTDKAVNPISVMGASKRVAEMVCQASPARGFPTRFNIVRFGNVLGSAGSVVPLFARQIAAGGPVTVTHPEVRRYFMTTAEAVALVLRTGALFAPLDSVFALDMGEPLRIQDLARRMIVQAGRDDIEIRFTGLRPGEKLDEEIFHAWEQDRPSGHAGIRVGSLRPVDRPALSRELTRLGRAAAVRRTGGTLKLLARLVPESELDALRDAA
jgi:O-antigen biosynthesis protein WbqV